jgi:hypothetical protein
LEAQEGGLNEEIGRWEKEWDTRMSTGRCSKNLSTSLT